VTTQLYAAEPALVPAKPEQFHLFILAGQSNMAGRGKVTEADKEPIDRVLSLNKNGEWVPAVDPLHWDKPGIAGVGLGRRFAADYAKENPAVTVGLMPCAVGGSPISAWEPEGYHKQTKTHPWDDAMQRIEPALKQGTITGILWHQGESDASPTAAPLYEEKLHALVARFRKELSAPELPFIVGQLGQFPSRPWNEHRKQIDSAHQSLVEKVPHTAFVPSDDLTHKGDNTHFDTKSCHEFGHRYFQAFNTLKTSSDK